MAKKVLTDTELKAIVDSEIYSSMGYMAGELSDNRAKAMDRYLGEPLGNEVEGRSKVKDRTVLDAIEWIMPSLIRIFSDQDNVVTVEPVGPEDEQAAEQETDYLNYLFYKKNQGFLILYTWFKDALLQKNGIVKLRVEEYDNKERETYENMTDQEMAFLMSDPDQEIIEYEAQTMASDMGMMPMTLHNATFIKHDPHVDICIDNIPPEDHLISSDARSVNPKEARFNAHYRVITVSELREMGFGDKEIDQMENGPHLDFGIEQIARKNLTDEQMKDYSTANEAMQTKKVYECYLKADKDGDGIAEILKIFRSGDYIESEEVETVPFNALTPVILTHKFHGLSVYDLLSDIEEIRTGLLRSYMDNIYQTINGTTYYDENTVNVEDMLTSKPYGIRAVNGSPLESIMHIPPSGLPPQAFEMFTLTDGLKQQRIGDFQAQIDPSVLANANTGVVMRMTMEAKAKTEMIARIFAETGVKELFRDLHEAARKHSNRQEVVKLRNNWIPINPSQWKERTDFTIKVGLGNATKEEKIANTGELINLMERGAAAGGVGQFITPENIYNAMTDYTKALGYANPDKYWTHPSKIPQQPPPPDPQMEMIKATTQIEQGKLAQKDQQAQREERLKMMEIQAKQQQAMGEERLKTMQLQITQLEAQAKLANDRTKNALEARASQIKGEMDKVEITFNQLAEQSRQAIDVYKAELQAGKDILIAHKKEVEAATPKKDKQKTDQLLVRLLDRIDAFEENVKKPKKRTIQRDGSGKPISIDGVNILRDENGRIIGTE